MEKGIVNQKLSPVNGERNSIVSRNHLVASIPPIRMLNRVGVHVPAAIVGVPVRIHGTQLLRMKYLPLHHPSITFRIEYYLES